MTHNEIEEAMPLYAAGALERIERQTIESHLLSGCAPCHSLLKEYQGVAALLPYGLPPVAPPPKAGVLAAVFVSGRTDAMPHQRFMVGGWWHPLATVVMAPSRQPMLALILLILLAATCAIAWLAHQEALIAHEERAHIEAMLNDARGQVTRLQEAVASQQQTVAGLREEFVQRLGTLGEAEDKLFEREAELDLLRREVAHQEQELGRLRKTVAERDEILSLLKSPHVKVVPLTGLDPKNPAGGILLYDLNTNKGVFYAFNMPPPPAGKTYQLWAMTDKPISAGTFGTDGMRTARMVAKQLPDFTQVTKFSVSVEPQGGRPHPTGQVYLAGGF